MGGLMPATYPLIDEFQPSHSFGPDLVELQCACKMNPVLFDAQDPIISA